MSWIDDKRVPTEAASVSSDAAPESLGTELNAESLAQLEDELYGDEDEDEERSWKRK
jgi:hypothetical protein